jgi:PAB1-binding protein PBP1
MVKTELAWSLSIAFVAAALAAAPAAAKSSGSTRSASSHSSASHSSSSGHARSASTTTRKPLPAGTHFIRKTCKTASCKAKHPGGSYMLPIKPKKGARPA